MESSDFQTQLQTEMLWRETEIRGLNNIIEQLTNDATKNMVRRATICLLYAHVEGFVKFSFKLYIDAINSMDLECSKVKSVLTAAVYYVDFMKIDNPDKKNKIFKKVLADDSHLHRIYRYEEFFERITDVFNQKIKIEDGYINTEGNVGKEVLQKLLYQVGLPHTLLDRVIGPLTRLMNKRNNIAHGTDKSFIADNEFNTFYKCCLEIMSELSRVLYLAYQNRDFLKQSNA
ncbi:TPA: MAE_28990/MAE_18760 family HEPN-like nuclease [Enterobacter hormaechei subsp. oharae]